MLRLSSFTADKGALNQVFFCGIVSGAIFFVVHKSGTVLSHYGSVEFCVEPNIEILAQIVVCAKSLKNSFLIKFYI